MGTANIHFMETAKIVWNADIFLLFGITVTFKDWNGRHVKDFIVYLLSLNL